MLLNKPHTHTRRRDTHLARDTEYGVGRELDLAVVLRVLGALGDQDQLALLLELLPVKTKGAGRLRMKGKENT